SRFTLLQYPDDLFFAEPAVLHLFVFLPQLRCFGKPSLEWLSSIGQGQVIVVRVARSQPTLNDLVGGITPGNRHGELDWGKSKGREIW
ncbi:MAG TPA: hypothetical protein VKX25_07150, partial [Bryobacteraceae bacterium]|nr:hypothetical protein [Bryobacteraceae bacterium]